MWLRSVRKLLSNAFGDVGHCSDPTLGCASSAPSGRSAAPRILHGVILTIPMPLKLDVFVPQGYKKGPQTGWRKTTEIYFLTVAKAGSSKSRCRQGRVPSEALGRTLPGLLQLLVATIDPWHSLAGSNNTPTSASVVAWRSPCVSLSPDFPLRIRTPVLLV